MQKGNAYDLQEGLSDKEVVYTVTLRSADTQTTSEFNLSSKNIDTK